jgi:hypothetical protein
LVAVAVGVPALVFSVIDFLQGMPLFQLDELRYLHIVDTLNRMAALASSLTGTQSAGVVAMSSVGVRVFLHYNVGYMLSFSMLIAFYLE